MTLTKLNQDLRRDLKAAAFTLEEAALDIFSKAQGYKEAEFQVAMEKVSKMHEQADRLKAYADEVKDQRITRAKANS
ncbi:Protease subunit of ATP-dependent Clp [Pseudomonas chlororaphis subsp. piscium]|uniref:hypothetical protein n=1 Tax=Pseudomonas chlororaphis TaxID=587753 RepID=UPI000F57834C|nr:hypothetical protein [Pseudomonas chlororaphis]AZC51817.1 Protease subunit of ATP-dependent Clp [Pseudomonas chlororaphis subsp. piscium]AZD85108.1 Protease subunit of ATP-dependent Clp [Pseudomonas chlororaphis subsp. aureofaciens]